MDPTFRNLVPELRAIARALHQQRLALCQPTLPVLTADQVDQVIALVCGNARDL